MENIKKRSALSAWIVEETANKHGVSDRHVRLVINGERKNEEIIGTYMTLAEGAHQLVEAVKKLVPFN